MDSEDTKAEEIAKEVEAKKDVIDFSLSVGGYSLDQTLGLRKWTLAQSERYTRKDKRAWRGHTRQAFLDKAADWHRQYREHNIRLAQYEIKFKNLVDASATVKAE